MRTVRTLAAFLFTAISVPLAAQQQQQAQNRWAEPKCDLKPNNVLVNQGMLYLKSATTGKTQTKIRQAQICAWYESPKSTNIRSAAPARNTTKIHVKKATPIAVRHGASRGRSSRLWNA